MMVRIVIPVRSLDKGKSRLAGALAPNDRAALILQMFRHVLGVAQATAPTTVISNDPQLRALYANVIPERDAGHNIALQQAAAELGGDCPLLALSADLPFLSGDDLQAMIAMLDHADVVAAPDRGWIGTNALLLARPGLVPYSFGQDSLARHRASAETRGLRFATISREGLATDIDLPSDLALVETRFSIRPSA